MYIGMKADRGLHMGPLMNKIVNLYGSLNNSIKTLLSWKYSDAVALYKYTLMFVFNFLNILFSLCYAMA